VTWGKLTLACSPSRGTDGLCATGRSAGLPGRRASRPGLVRARGPAHRAGPQDHLSIGEGSVVRPAHRTGVVGRDRKRLGDGYPGRHVVAWAGQVDGAGSREDPLGFGGLRKIGSTDPGPDLAPCNGVRPAWQVYENTCRTTRERLVGGIATRKGQASRGPGPGHVIGKSLGRGVTRRSKTRTGFGHKGPTHARYGLVWNPLHVSSLLYTCHNGCQLSIFTAACVHPR
jgi:hypothetical protein